MAILVGVGSSKNRNTQEAVIEAAKQACQPLAEFPPSFFLVLASPSVYNQQEMLNTLKFKYPQTVMIGGSTSGEITTQSVDDNSLAIMAIYSDQIKFVPGKGSDIRIDARLAGKNLAENIIKNADGQLPKTALIFPDSLSGNTMDVVRGVLDVFGQNFLMAGGSPGDDGQLKKTSQYYQNELLENSVSGVGLYGNFRFGIGVRHGWIPIGNSRKVTKAKSNILYELDNKPAIQIYEDQFGKDKVMINPNEPFGKLAITYPLGIVLVDQSEYLIRDPITVDENGAISCAAEVPEGAEVYIMIGSQEEAIQAAKNAAQRAMEEINNKTPAAAILFNCIARKKLLMNKKQEEIKAVQNIIGSNVPLIGFYTYGEIAPFKGIVNSCFFHNETVVAFLLTE
jgi:hypothetical protein